ncbi:hypothetical protein B484DRAFT_399035 [Ochromonadaceae sp. CCMP2298]|nr:hypothetical protein B484DRAFT_399035 [Ochromonadaceae sp. CCMP2298]
MEEIPDPIPVDVTETIGYGLLNEAEKQERINETEAEYLHACYKKLFARSVEVSAHDVDLSRRLSKIGNCILEEKIAIEQTRIEEVEETRQLQHTGEVRSTLHSQMESSQQKNTIAQYELVELQGVHGELTVALSSMKKQNSELVQPVLQKLRKEITELNEEMEQVDDAHARDDLQKFALAERLAELQSQRNEKQELLRVRQVSLKEHEKEPWRLERAISAIHVAQADIRADLHKLEVDKRTFDAEQEEQATRRANAEKMRTKVLETLELNRETLEEREQDVSQMAALLDNSRAIGHDLVTRLVELNVKRREAENGSRHMGDQLLLASKELDILKRQLKRKRIIAATVRQAIPVSEEALEEAGTKLQNLLDERSGKLKELARYREEVDQHMARLLQQEGAEGGKRKGLEQSIDELDDLEAIVMQKLAEGKQQSKLLGVLTAKRDITSRDCVRIDVQERESKAQVRMKELVLQDLVKRCNEISNRLKEFSALYEVVKNERNKYVGLIQSSGQALAEMREKIRILLNEQELLNCERAAKDVAMAQKIALYQTAMNYRDALRQDVNRQLAEYHAKQATVGKQIQEIDKYNMVINSLEKDMLHLKGKYEQAVEDRNITGVQLIDRNDELCILYERSNQQQDTMRRGEVESTKKEEELRLVRLQGEELKRRYITAKRRLPELDVAASQIKELEESLKREVAVNCELSDRLEDPNNLDRWRALAGKDPDMEQLMAKIRILDDLMDRKREVLLEKELVLEELSSLTEKLRTQALSRRDSAKVLAEKLNGLHGRIRDVTKQMLASVAELSMYQASALRLQQEKLFREKVLEEAEWRIKNGEAPSEEAVRELGRDDRRTALIAELLLHRTEELSQEVPEGAFKTAAEPRPTAYIPDDSIGIPRPYGMSPFKPSDLGAVRHIRNPQPQSIEI